MISDFSRLDFIIKLRPVSYVWKTGADEARHYGLIVQETEKAVADSKNQYKGALVIFYDR